MQLRSLLAGALAALTVSVVTAAPASASPARGSLLPLTDSAARRVLVADKVAAAKFPDQPITDPAREQQVLDMARAKAVELGLDPDATVTFFRDQIEASKVVQYGLFAWWTAHPDQAPTTKPDLPTEVRPVIDRLNAELLAELADTVATRASEGCAHRLPVAVRVTDLRRHLDRLHERALDRAVVSVCG
ncbi:chorismate mutase [Amycolatopsis anabasis]|uniref:chorismate mutase n=1 Tax=Amycolatopsis anabasis TaxID=1840409 RepID=UPI00131DF674|nr:chorismate mutase [Amycolatopsis anabasis]